MIFKKATSVDKHQSINYIKIKYFKIINTTLIKSDSFVFNYFTNFICPSCYSILLQLSMLTYIASILLIRNRVINPKHLLSLIIIAFIVSLVE